MSTRIDSTPTGAADVCLPGDAPSFPTTEYVVKPGDTLSKLADGLRQAGLSGSRDEVVQQLLDLNPQVTDKNLIRVGQQLTLPKPAEAKPAHAESHHVESFSPNASYADPSMAACFAEGPTFSAAMLMMSGAPAANEQSVDPSSSAQASSPVTAPGANAPASGAKKPSGPEKKKEAPKSASSSAQGTSPKNEAKPTGSTSASAQSTPANQTKKANEPEKKEPAKTESSGAKPKKTVGPSISKKAITTEMVPEKAPAGFEAVALKVPWYSQFANHGSVKGGGTQCNAMAREMMKDGKNTAAPGPGNATWNINVAESKDAFGRIQPNVARAKEGRAYIDAQLDAGHPVLVGVMWRTPVPGYNGGNADHYVAITGRGVAADGTAYYTFNDPGATSAAKGADTRENNRFFVDADTGMLFRPGLQEVPGKMYTVDARYEVSQVRKNQ